MVVEMPGTEPRLVSGRYEMGEALGYGGMAEVYRGRDVLLGRQVAIKTLRSDLAHDPTFVARFRREARSVAALSDPAIVQVYDTGEDVVGGATIPYIVMEYVEGRTLRDVLADDGPLPERDALEITSAVCGALDYSHRMGIVHRDIKPANVMLTPDGSIKVMDFGIARAMTANTSAMTQTAMVIGTAQYLSPEQARGEKVDARSDVYTTGVLLYELLTGTQPFQGDNPVAIAYQHVQATPRPPSAHNPRISPQADAIVLAAMMKDREDRYQTAGQMRDDIGRALAGQPVYAMGPPPESGTAATMLATPGAGRTRTMRQDLGDAGAATRYAANRYDPVTTGRATGAPPGGGAGRSRTGLYLLAAVAVIAIIALGAWLATSLSGGSGGAAGTAGTTVTTQPTTADSGTATSLVQVPTVIGLTQQGATTALQTAGLTASPRFVNASGGTAGTVVGSNPGAGSSVATGSIVVIDVVGNQGAVPNVVGDTRADALRTLHAAGFTHIATRREASQQPDGQVINQNPAANSTADLGTTVRLVLSRQQTPTTGTTTTTGPTATISPTPAPTPTPTTSGGTSGPGGTGGTGGPTPPAAGPPAGRG
jgi:eukaryotic-like serine/threonine-protein kinase